MQYFIVNNSYHLLDAVKHIDVLGCDNCILIVVAHTIDLSLIDGMSVRVIEFPKLISSKFDYFAISKWLKFKELIDKNLCVQSDDVLIFYTELEFSNLVLVKYCYDREMSVYQIEDNGLATYIQLNANDITLFNSSKMCFIKRFFGLKGKEYFLDGMLYYRIEDKYLSGMILYSPVGSGRGVPICYLSMDVKSLVAIVERKQFSVMFLNQDIYNYYMSWSEYRRYLLATFDTLLDADAVYFKFHPREDEVVKSKIKKMLSGFDVIYIHSSQPVEIIVDTYLVSKVVTFMSSAALNLYRMGYEVSFNYQLYPSYMDYQNLRVLDELNLSIFSSLPYGTPTNLKVLLDNAE